MLDSIPIKTAQGQIKTATLNKPQSDFDLADVKKDQSVDVSPNPEVVKPTPAPAQTESPTIKSTDPGFSHFKKDNTQEILEKLLNSDKKDKPAEPVHSEPKETPVIKKDKVNLSPHTQEDKEEVKLPENKIAPEEATPAFYFDLEDEQEVAQFRNKDKVNLQKSKKILIEDLIQQAIDQAVLTLSTEEKIKLSKILESYFRGVRTLVSLQEALQQATQNKSLNLSESNLESLIEIAKKLKIDFENNKIKIPEIKVEEKKSLPTKEEKAAPAKPVNKTQEILNKNFIAAQDKKVPGKIVPSSEGVYQPAKPAPQAPIQNQQISRRVVGPIEELASYDLVSFRSLNEDPIKALKKIKEKLDMLQEDSYEKRAAGIKAWYTSPIYKQYLILGQESIDSGKDVKTIVDQRKKTNSPTLSNEEFEAIADFNAELAY